MSFAQATIRIGENAPWPDTMSRAVIRGFVARTRQSLSAVPGALWSSPKSTTLNAFEALPSSRSNRTVALGGSDLLAVRDRKWKLLR